MSTQPDLALWDESVTFLYNDQPEQSLVSLKGMKSHTSKTMFNMGMACSRMGCYEDAVKFLTKATEMDPHLAIGYFERGNLNFKLQRYDDALRDFQLGQAKLGDHRFIDYSQLGMRARLYQDEFVDRQKYCRYVLEGCDQVPELRSDASREIVFRPPKNKIANMHKMDYLGKPKVVTVLDKNDNFAGFAGLKKLGVKSAPSSPTAPKRNKSKSPVPDSSDSPKPTRLAPLPPKMDAIPTVTPPPRRAVQFHKVPLKSDQPDDHLVVQKMDGTNDKFPRSTRAQSKESSPEIEIILERTEEVPSGDHSFKPESVLNPSSGST
ncbi:hypothetical protein LSH36_716g00007 [Paralvinella palmiformis]|uniref:Uncharacterized protein n=1 Tax=Paralvinella palmiformis TaxID=53620 RepID=A0AAD9J247_9ANNE|nr:hypothetical protein LSH36_716g00007 [Paralvinella palmiformis]